MITRPLSMVRTMVAATSVAGVAALAWSGVVLGVAGPSVALASSSAPYSASAPPLAAGSPATTVVSTPTAPSTPATTVPGTHTGEPWASRAFVAVIVGAVLLGAVLLQPVLRRRSRTDGLTIR